MGCWRLQPPTCLWLLPSTAPASPAATPQHPQPNAGGWRSNRPPFRVHSPRTSIPGTSPSSGPRWGSPKQHPSEHPKTLLRGSRAFAEVGNYARVLPASLQAAANFLTPSGPARQGPNPPPAPLFIKTFIFLIRFRAKCRSEMGRGGIPGTISSCSLQQTSGSLKIQPGRHPEMLLTAPGIPRP